ncbi:MAG: diacylglycerol kinase family protein [Syntrophomonadaceae bacterium]|jgi:diacylglycerol kinase|nr:diacylglycerol kinase family protein [Syntrophomonadaceae bacterium]
MARHTLTESFYYAIVGLVSVLISERNMRIHFLAMIVVVIFSFLVSISPLEWALLIITIFMVLIAETINTAVEKTVDLVTDTYHPLAKKAKNIAAGAVLLSAVNAVIIALIILGPYLRQLIYS